MLYQTSIETFNVSLVKIMKTMNCNFNFSFSSTNKMEGKNAKVESFGISIKTQWNTLKESEWVSFP